MILTALHLLFRMNLVQQKVMFFMRLWLLRKIASHNMILRICTQQGVRVLHAAMHVPLCLGITFHAGALGALWHNSCT